MKRTALFVVLVLAIAVPVFAQGPFNDVPTDHWAYDAVNKLQKDGVIIGYPDGTFGGKRAMSRYEFAVAIARLRMPEAGAIDTSQFATKSELGNYVKKSELPDFSKFATKADVDALRKLIDEFRDEIAALGVDVDALKRDVAALGARVDALEAEQKRVRLTGDVNVFGVATANRGNNGNSAFDLDERNLGTGRKDTLGRTISVVKDFDLNIVGRVGAATTANATINYGNYLNYLAFVDDYVGGQRPTSKGGDSTAKDTLSDNFFPYYLYIDSAFGKGGLTVGRFPLQFTPYTLKKIDVDSYTSILKTDDGNYPVDGAKVNFGFGGVDLTLFAAKHDTNDYLINGLTSHPNAGLYGPNTGSPYVFFDNGVVGHALGGLPQITQTAGVRALIGTPWKGNLGLTYYQGWSSSEFFAGAAYDQTRVFGADLAIPFGSNFGFAGSWTKSDILARDGAAASDIDSRDTAWDAKLTAGLGKLGIGAGYKRIERNFAAAGNWDKIGRWTNPSDVKGPYADFTYPISRKLQVVLNGEFLKMIDTVTTSAAQFGVADDELFKAEGGIKWGFSKTNTLDLGYQWVKFSPQTTGLDEAIETYLTIGWAHQLNANTGFKIGYQLINYDDGATLSGPYAGDYRGGLGVVQFGVSF